MEAARDLLRLLDQPPSEAAWAAFAEAAEKLPDSALEGLLPEMLARLASWPDHLRISKPEWESRGNNLLNALCRIFPITPALNLSDVFNQELEEILEAQKESIENGTFDDTVLDAGGAHFMSKKRIVRGIHFDQASKEIFALQSDYFVLDQDNLDPGYDHLFRINFQKGSCLRMRTFTRSNSFDTTDCLLIEAISPDASLSSQLHKGMNGSGMPASFSSMDNL